MSQDSRSQLPINEGRKYRNPPVIEALCEIYFAESAWDDTIPGRFYERVRDRFPSTKQIEIHEAEVSFHTGGKAAAGL
ncbi:MAG: TIGR04255 family protein [Planctomycetes bacterium]|nr:TIGR04255 family protein [Planctomycetota bacterium]